MCLEVLSTLPAIFCYVFYVTLPKSAALERFNDMKIKIALAIVVSLGLLGVIGVSLSYQGEMQCVEVGYRVHRFQRTLLLGDFLNSLVRDYAAGHNLHPRLPYRQPVIGAGS